MSDPKNILQLIKNSVHSIEPTAVLILYGSYARGDNRDDSDIDILVLLDKDKITYEDQKKVQYPLYDIELETGIIISPMIYSKRAWKSKRHITPFYENVIREGKNL